MAEFFIIENETEIEGRIGIQHLSPKKFSITCLLHYEYVPITFLPTGEERDEGWKLNRTNYYQEGWLATGNIRGIVGVTFTTSHCKKNVDYPLRTNHNLRGHRSEVILVKWNEPYQKLASCDSSGIIFVWLKYEGRWSIELINDRNIPVTHFSWSHDGRMALICYQDGFVLVGSVAGQRYWSSMLNLEATITCGIWTPDDQQVYFGTTSGQIIVMDVHGAMVSQVQLTNESGITTMAWSCEKFKMEEGDNDPGVSNAGERKFVLAVCLQNGLVYLLKTFDDVSPLHIQTGLQAPLCMEWSNSRELLAIAGVESTSKGVGNQIEYSNILKFYNQRGILLYRTKIPFMQAAVTSLTWGHNDKRLFIATGTQIHIAWVSRRIATLQLLCRLKIHDSIMHETHLPLLPLPARIRNLIGNLFAQTIRCCVPEPSSLREFVSRPPVGSVRLHCTMIRHDDDNNSSSGTCYTLYLEYLGGLVPLLKGKRTSKIRPEFVIFDPQVEIPENGHHWSSETKSSGSSSQSTSGGGMLTDSSDSEKEEGCTNSPRMQRRRKKRNKSHGRTPQSDRSNNPNPSEGENDDLAYVDTLPEYIPLVEVTSNIWGTKFKIHGLPSSTPANLGQVTYKTSLLHLQPRQMTLIITELTDDFPVGPDPTFNPNLFSEDEEEAVQADEKNRLSRIPIENCPPIAPILPRGSCLGKKPSPFNSSFLTPESQKKNGPVLARAESYEDEVAFPDLPEVISYCDIIRPQTSSSTNNNNIYLNLRPSNTQSSSFVAQFNKNTNGNTTNQRHAISPLYCEGSVPALQSPKNAVAPSDIIFDRPPAQTLISYSCDYSNTNNVQQIKSNILNEVPRNGLSFQSLEHRTKMTKTSEKTQNKLDKNTPFAKNCPNDGQRQRAVPNSQPRELKFIDEENMTEAVAGPSNIRTSNLSLPDSIVRSCSMGYLDMIDAQLVPSEVTLLMLRKDAPRRLVLVNKKPKQKRQSRQTSRHFQETSKSMCDKTPNLKNCGKSKSLDSSDIFIPEKSNPIRSVQNQIEEVIPEVVNIKKPIECKSTSSSSTDNENNRKECSKLGFFGSRSPLMRRKKDKDSGKDDKKSRGKSKKQQSLMNKKNDSNSKQNLPLHTQALTNLERLITRLREDDGRNSAPASPRLPRSSPASPAPSKKGKRPQSASPIRKNLLSSPLLGRRNRKNKLQESSDDDVTASGDEIFNGTNYRDLETFQKAQLRQKLKRGKIEPNGSSFNNPPIPQRREFVMHNKAPMWNENSQVYQLDFGGRVTQESAKNFQIEFRGKQVMQFGRIDGNAYTLDFQYPFSALQAFSVALANVTQRLK